jgi:hypothetical protein
MCHSAATAFAERLFPQPGTPSRSTPRGKSSPNSSALSGLGDDRLSLGQPRFEAPQISDLREGGLHRVVLQQAIPLDYGDLCLDHMLDVLERELPIFDDGLRQDFPGLHE